MVTFNNRVRRASLTLRIQIKYPGPLIASTDGSTRGVRRTTECSDRGGGGGILYDAAGLVANHHGFVPRTRALGRGALLTHCALARESPPLDGLAE